jgi:hypothetical protein
MRSGQKNLGLAAAVAVGLCGVASAGQGPYPVPRCHASVGVPCAPKRETYCYFPTTWRRWPTEQGVAAGGQQPEAGPTPAQQPPPAIEPEVPEALPAPSTATPPPGAPSGEPPKSPLVPPFEESPPKAPSGDTLLPPPFEDAPPLPPGGGGNTTAPPFNAFPPGGVMPSDRAPQTPRPAPGADIPPVMPNDDPFKDDPDSNLGPPPGGAPQSSENTPDAPAAGELEIAPQQAAARGNMLESAPPEIETPPLAPPSDEVAEPWRLNLHGKKSPSAALPDRPDRINPLRSSSRASRRKPIVAAASFTAVSPAADRHDGSMWRRNPLRAN